MFVKLDDFNALCVSAYKDVQVKAVVPSVNELWEQVDECAEVNGWVTMTQEEIQEFMKPVLSEQELAQQEHEWVKSELKNVDLQISLHLTDDRRAIYTLEDWKKYARDLRDYTSESDGVVTVNSEVRPSIGQ